eukprot:gene23195-29390_t
MRDDKRDIQSSRLRKASHRLPSGSLVPKESVHSAGVSKVDQIFKQKYQLASIATRVKELRFKRSHRYCYSTPNSSSSSAGSAHISAGGDSLLDPSLKRFTFNHSALSSTSSTESKSSASDVMSRELIPLPFVDFASLLSRDEVNSVSSQIELIQTSRLKASNTNSSNTQGNKSDNIQSDISSASRIVYTFTRNYNKYTREHPEDVATLLQIAASLDVLDHHQRVASGSKESSAAILTNKCRVSRHNNVNNARAVLDRRISLLEYALKQLDNKQSNALVTLQLYLVNLYTQSHEDKSKIISFLDTASSVADTTNSTHYGTYVLISRKYQHILSLFNDVNHSFLRDEFTQRILSRVHEQLNRQAVSELQKSQAADARATYWESVTASAQSKNERSSQSINNTNATNTHQHHNYSSQLTSDTECLQIDLLAQWLLVERLYGNTEKQMAVIQTLLDINLCPPHSASFDDFEQFWESEHLRLGERDAFPSALTVSNTNSNTNSDDNNNKFCGYQQWLQSDRPSSCTYDNRFLATDHDTLVACEEVRRVFEVRCDTEVSPIEVSSDSGAAAATETEFVDGSGGCGVAMDVVTAAGETSSASRFNNEVQCNNNNSTDSSSHAEFATNNVNSASRTETIPTTTTTTTTTSTSSDIIINNRRDKKSSKRRAVDFFVENNEDNNEYVSARQRIIKANDTAAAPVAYITTDNHDTNNNDEEEEEDDNMVYSAVHGYKIKITSEDSKRPYLKLLGDTLQSEVSGVADDEEEEGEGVDFSALSSEEILRYFEVKNSERKKAKLSLSQQTVLMPPFDPHQQSHNSNQNDNSDNVCEDVIKWRSDVTKWRSDLIVSLFQHSPLRLNTHYCEQNTVNTICNTTNTDNNTTSILCSEIEPERVVLFRDDIYPYIRNTSTSSQSARQRLVIRCLQTVSENSLFFPHAEHSHSEFSRSTAAYRVSGRSSADFSYGLMRRTETRKSSSNTNSTQTSNAKGNIILSVYHKLSKDFVKLNSICLVRENLLHKHRVCVLANRSESSELNAAINLVSGVIQNNDNNNTNMLSFEFVCELRCVLISLLFARYLLEQQIVVNTAINNTNNLNTDITTTTTDNTTTSTTLTALFRTQCQSIIERSVSPSHNVCGDLSCWGEYIRCEGVIKGGGGGSGEEGKKLADKVLKAISSQPPQSTQSITQLLKFCALCVQLALGTESYSHTANHSSSSPPSVEALTNAASILVTLAHSGHLQSVDTNNTSIGQNDSVLGVYCGVLKPLKQPPIAATATATSGKKKVPPPKAPPSNVTRESVSSAVRVVEGRIQELLHTTSQSLQHPRAAAAQPQQTSESHQRQQRIAVTVCDSLNYETDLLLLAALHAHLIYVQSSLYGSTSSSAVRDAVSVDVRSVQLADSALSRHIDDNNTFITRQSLTADTWDTVSSPSHNQKSVAHHEALHSLGVCGREEMMCAVTLERLHCMRVSSLLQAVNRCGDRQPQHNATLIRAALDAVRQGLNSFPLNTLLLHSLITIQRQQPLGFLSVSAYFSNIHSSRVVWGGGLSHTERLFELQMEMHRADKAAQQEQFLYDYTGDKTKQSVDSDGLDSFKSHCDYLSLDCFTAGALWSVESYERVRRLLESTLSVVESPQTHGSFVFWRCYVQLEVARRHFEEGKKVLYRAVSSCAYCRDLYLEAVGPLRCVFTDKELASILQVMEDKEVHMRQLLD